MFQKKMDKISISFNKSKGTLHLINQINTRNKTCLKFCYDLLKSIFITVKMIRSSSDHAVFSWIYKNYEYFLAVKTDDIFMETQNIIFFEILMQEFNTLLDYKF